MKWILAAHFIAFANPVSRTVQMTADTICKINTALGHSTVLQLENRPVSVVVGDQDAYKVETVGNNITLKPLLPGARSNLFVFFSDRSFTFDLQNTSKTNPDYFVSVRTLSPRNVTDPTPPKIHMKLVDQQPVQGKSSIRIVSIGRPPSNSAVLLRFALGLDSDTPLENIQIGFAQPEDFIAPSSIHFDQPPNASRKTFTGITVIRRSSFNPAKPLFLTARIPQTGPLHVRVPTEILDK